MSVSFTKNQDEITKAWRDVVNSKDTQNWAVFGYEGSTNNMKLMSTGSNGLEGLVNEFNCSLIQYAFCRVIDSESAINRLVLINWQGESSPLSRKGLCASHVGDVTSYFRGCNQTITIRNDDEATAEYLMEQILKTSSKRVNLTRKLDDAPADPNSPKREQPTKKLDLNSEIAADRKSFWQKQEEEDKQRLVEEKQRAAEKQAQFERERKLREQSEAKKLAEAIEQRDKLIEATRQAEKKVQSSQQASMISGNSDGDDDGRVGRRSELIRLERNQETQSLISKGLIKNTRAIFEQACQQQQKVSSSNNHAKSDELSRRPSGTIITQRLNTFQPQESNNVVSSNAEVEKLTNGLSEQVNLTMTNNSNNAPAKVVTKEVEPIKVTKNYDEKQATNKSSIVNDQHNTEEQHEEIPIREEPKESESFNDEPTADPNGNDSPKIVQDKNKQNDISDNNQIPSTKDIRARALYDYQATDNSEISFDPEDLIGHIDKVDSGWWHGTVISGKYTGQSGLFPSNYVEEL